MPLFLLCVALEIFDLYFTDPPKFYCITIGLIFIILGGIWLLYV